MRVMGTWRLGLSAALLAAIALVGCVSAPVSGTGIEAAQSQTMLEGQARFPEALAAGGQVLPTGIGSVIQAAPGAYRVAHAGHTVHGEPVALDFPVAGALVVLRDPVTQAPLNGGAPARTDAEGRYAIAAPAGANHLVEVLFRLAPQGPVYRLMTLGRVGDAVPADVTWATSAATAALLESPPSDLRQYPLAQLHAEAASRRAVYQELPAEEQAPLMTAILKAPADALGTILPVPLPSLQPAPATPAPTSSPAPAASLVPAVVETVASTLPVVTETVKETEEAAEEVVDTVLGPLLK